MKVLVVNNKRLTDTMEMGERVSLLLRRWGNDVLIDSCSQDATTENFDSIIVLGGDGTMIRAARQYADRNVPILGVNMGTVGFLSNIRAAELEYNLQRFINQDYSIEERMLQKVTVSQNDEPLAVYYSLNEVSIKSKCSRVLSLDVQIAGFRHGVYRGDGIIIATPSGSTAYSLSCGGPVIDPVLKVFVLTPINSYILNKRPMVIDADKHIDVTLVDGEEVYVSIDGQISLDIDKSSSVNVRTAEHGLRLVNMKPRHFFKTIRKRLQRDDNY